MLITKKSDKYVSDEFLTHVVYGCQVVVTNPTSSRQRLDVLLQVPQGAISRQQRPLHPRRAYRCRSIPIQGDRVLLLLPQFRRL